MFTEACVILSTGGFPSPPSLMDKDTPLWTEILSGQTPLWTETPLEKDPPPQPPDRDPLQRPPGTDI